jgi:hypothetical protein
LKIRFVIPWLLIFVIAVSSCSINISQPSLITPSPQVGTVPSVLPPTTLPDGSTTQQTTIAIPITWAGLDLSGKLIYTNAVFQGQSILMNIRSLDLTTGVVTTIYQAPESGWIDAVAVSPDSTQLLLSYAPPRSLRFGGQRALNIMPLDGSKAPQLLFPPPSPDDEYFQPEWSPDGNFVYFTHRDNQSYLIDVWRLPYPNGNLEELADNASWPRVSSDGTRLVYVWVNPRTGLNRLVLANSDGTDARKVRLKGSPIYIIDAPMFSAANESIILSAPFGVKASAPNWIDKLLDVQVVLANGSVPSDWWTVPVTGGKIKRLTNIQRLALFGNFSPDKKHIASYSTDGIFVMKPDGTEVTMLVNEVGGISGTVSWIP